MAQKQDGMRGHGTFATIGFRVRETSLPLWIGIGQLQASNTQGTEMPGGQSETGTVWKRMMPTVCATALF